jgi:hypothetical protein
VNDGLASRTVIMIFLNYRSALGRLTLFNHGSTVPVSVSVEIPVTLTYGYASAYGADADANTQPLQPVQV